MTKSRVVIIDSPVGFLRLEAEGGFVTALETGVAGPATETDDPILKRAITELGLYFTGKLRNFTVPVKRPPATDFVNRVHDAMVGIPYGKTATYGEVAAIIGSAPRAVGGACGKNAIAIIIPCHRIVAAGGLGGYGGDWERGRAISVKKVLLETETDVLSGDSGDI